jgi:conjugative transposon TraN protein
MKKLLIVLIVMLPVLHNYAQDSAAPAYVQISSEPLAIAVGKTTNLIFPFSIKSVDRGSRDVLVQKANGLENILQVKAARECFEATNLTVITTEGKLYSYSVSYDEDTTQLNLDYAKGNPTGIPSSYNEGQIKALSDAALASEHITSGITDKSGGVTLQVRGLFVHENLFFFKIKIKNSTNINYDISQLRLFIKDQKKAKRTASQENEIVQSYVHNPRSLVRGNSEETVVIAVPKFTIPDKKEMILQVMEKDGGRNLEVRVRHRAILKAVPLNLSGL